MAAADDYPLEVRPGLSLELQHPDLAEAYFALLEDNLPRLAAWEPWASEPHTLATTRTFLAWQAQAFVSRTQLPFVIVLDGRPVGSCSARLDATEGTADVGYWVGAAAEGAGIAFASVAALVEHVFARGDTFRVQARTAVGNQRSRALLERLGFAFEGVQRSAQRMPGRRVDLAVYAKTAG
ncbi:GNAT family protein [Conyzicola nivalis]|uniref:Acetyltransferase n=1 Tax=Conyzicola nivalis TaxID=1477021 RepID=A0A916SHJ0_9MICO|nr:GNAT family protein [Conyzicola nivalis]GGA99336.1 acetyltransferase [Conyzicola nivalis]